MSEPRIRRRFRAVPITIGTVTQASTAIRWDEAAGGSLQIGTHVTASQFVTAVQLWASDRVDGTYARLHDDSGSPADLTVTRDSVTATVYALPDAAYGVGALRVVAGSTHLVAATVLLKT